MLIFSLLSNPEPRVALLPYGRRISILEPSSSRVLALVMEKPGYQTSVHLTVYMSTSRKEAEFMKDLTILQDTIEYVGERYSDSLVFVRGDANASFNPRDKNKHDELFCYFVEENKLCCVQIHHKTYHHFRGNGISDSNIDVILHPKVTSAGLPNTQYGHRIPDEGAVWQGQPLEYRNLLDQTLPSLQSDYSSVDEPEVASILFQVTNHMLTEAA